MIGGITIPFSIIGLIGSKRNDKCIKKTINYQLKIAGEISNSIFLIFKRLYFDIMVNKKDRNNFDALGKETCQNLVKISLKRFKKVPEELQQDKFVINVDTELRAFLKTCGIVADDKEVEFMLHLIDNYNDSHYYHYHN